MISYDLKHPLVKEAINTLRFLSADAVERAGSGHPGTPMEAAPAAYLIFSRHLRHNPGNPLWPGRDRFILSCGHASALLYSLLHLSGYDLGIEDIKSFRQLGSRTAGHPEFGHCPGVETTTGPLGQGFAVGVGMAMGARFLNQQVDSELFDSRIYALVSDGDLMEGVSAEAASLAGHLGLGNLIYVYLDNRITIEGKTELAFSEEVATRFLACGWHVERADGENLLELDSAIERAKLDPRPSLVIARTHIGFGAPNKQDSAEAHGSPLGAEELRQAKMALGADPDKSFYVSEPVRHHLLKASSRGSRLESAWQKKLRRRSLRPGPGLLHWLQVENGEFPDGWEKELPRFSAEDGAMSTRQASGIVLNVLAARLPLLLGGSADLAPSNNTWLKGEKAFERGGSGRNIHFGVREHAMGALLNGMAHIEGLIPFGGTFLIFSDYMRPPMRLAAMMGLAPVYVFTHDSIGLGEDGPTHQPVEQLAGLRLVPNLQVLRPCDANETVEAWRLAVARRTGPTALVLSRQALPVLDRRYHGPVEGVRRGGYVLAVEPRPLEVLLIATGSEVHLALEAARTLKEEGVGARVVSMPCREIFDQQEASYREKVLPAACRARVVIEAGLAQGWEKYAGTDGSYVCMEGFGASAPAKQLMSHFGFTAEAVVRKVRAQLGR